MANGYNDVHLVIEDLRNDFIFGRLNSDGIREFLSLKRIAEIYKVSYPYLRQEYSVPEDWISQRKEQRKQFVQDKANAKAEHQLEKSLSIDEDYENIFKVTRNQAFEEMKSKKGNLRSIDYFHYSNTFATCYEGEKYANGESLEKQDNNSGWDALEKSLRKHEEQKKEKE